MVDAALIILNEIGYPLGVLLIVKYHFHPKMYELQHFITTHSIIGGSGLLFSSGVLISSFTTALWSFLLFYAFFNGIGQGMAVIIILIKIHSTSLLYCVHGVIFLKGKVWQLD